jgi:hypothetical protein
MPRLNMRIRPNRRRPIRMETLLQVASHRGSDTPFWEAVSFALNCIHEDPDYQNMTLEAAVGNLCKGASLTGHFIEKNSECDCIHCARFSASALVGLAAFAAFVASEMRLFPEGPSLPPVAIHNPPGSDPEGS